MEKKLSKTMGIILVVVMSIVSIGFFVFMKDFSTNSSAQIEALKGYQPTRAVVVSIDKSPARINRGGASLVYKIQYRVDNELITSTIRQAGMMSFVVGDSVDVYYDPIYPQTVYDSESYLEMSR